jgi:hypothetical protein
VNQEETDQKRLNPVRAAFRHARQVVFPSVETRAARAPASATGSKIMNFRKNASNSTDIRPVHPFETDFENRFFRVSRPTEQRFID